jgi:hypothetical protein
MAALLQSFDRKLSRALGQLDIGPLEYLAAPAAFLFGWEGTILVMGPATGLYDADLCRHYCLSGMLGQVCAGTSLASLSPLHYALYPPVFAWV